MGCEVYANGDEIACKAGDGKVIAAFPDVCLTPPTPPAGPLPVPYPDTSFSKDMKDGSSTVKIKGKEVMLKDASYYKSSPLGNEAATKSQGAGVVTHVITGKTYFVAWSMDVKFEGQNVDRHTDFTTSNHASPMANNQVAMINAAFTAPGGAPPHAGLCKCCGLGPHPGQQGGIEVSQDKWYGLDEGPDIENAFDREFALQPNPLHRSAHKAWRQRMDKIATRADKLDARQKAVAAARANNCTNLLPAPPCDTYYVFPQESTDTDVTASLRKDEMEEEWNAYSPTYRALHADLKPNETIHHRVPKAAGGCPTGDGNLTPDGALSPECREVETQQLKKAQDSAIENWHASLSPALVP